MLLTGSETRVRCYRLAMDSTYETQWVMHVEFVMILQSVEPKKWQNETLEHTQNDENKRVDVLMLPQGRARPQWWGRLLAHSPVCVLHNLDSRLRYPWKPTSESMRPLSLWWTV